MCESKWKRTTIAHIDIIDRANRISPDGEQWGIAFSQAQKQLRFERSHPFQAWVQRIRSKPPYQPLNRTSWE